MEQYLIDEYNVLSDKELTEESQIEDWARDRAYDELNCGQGYYQESCTLIAMLQNGKFYEVCVNAEIFSSKQDVGDRLYWVEDIKSVEYKQIEKPLPKKRELYNISANLTSEQKSEVDALLKRLNIIAIETETIKEEG